MTVVQSATVAIISDNRDPHIARQQLGESLASLTVVRPDSLKLDIVEADLANWKLRYELLVMRPGSPDIEVSGVCSRVQLERPDFGRDYHYVITITDPGERAQRVLYNNFHWNDGLRILNTNLEYFPRR